MNLDEELENIRVLNGQIKALQEKQRELSDLRVKAKDRIHAHMQQTLAQTYGPEYLPRVTLYVDEKQMTKTAKNFKAEVTLVEVSE